ncbi:unnamed protein product [Blepharisma stoltei]|uniref:Signal recognition particle 14 kDa protein n=1 Tax=Blepharisma stoltei TaxID=1481888 RepID=A0AAU9ISG4_9CILI|nr:unnamed protein product [Blepharisma stoltei]
MLLDNENFLKRLEQLYQEKGEKGSVWITFKQYDEIWRKGMHRKGKDKIARKEDRQRKNQEGVPLMLLVRAKTDTEKISTKVLPEDVAYFQKVLHNAMLVSMVGKKRLR